MIPLAFIPRLGLLGLLLLAMLSGCVGNKSGPGVEAAVQPVQNKLTVTVDAGPSAAPGQINHAYVTVSVCAPGSHTQCATVDHVLLDTGSIGLRLVGSVLDTSLKLASETDSQGQTIEECVTFGGGQTWGPIALADVTLAGEVAAKVPVQVMDDSGAAAAAPVTCGANGTLLNGVAAFGANGVLGVGVFAQDCGSACVAAATPLPVYYGCSSNGSCTAENAALSVQVSNPAMRFGSDNNGVIVQLPNLQSANGDNQVTGVLIFGLGTQSDNTLPASTLTVLGTDVNGNFNATYNGGTTVLPALIDSGADAYLFDDPTMVVCSSGAFVGYYCPAVAPQSVYAVNTGMGTSNMSNTVNFAIADPNTFVAGASAFTDLGGGGGSTSFTWGMPFFYGRSVYIGFEQRSAGTYTGPFFAY